MSDDPLHKVLHTIQVQGFKLEFRERRTAKRTLGSIAAISPQGDEIEMHASFTTLDEVIEGVRKLRERMREDTTQDLGPPLRDVAKS